MIFVIKFFSRVLSNSFLWQLSGHGSIEIRCARGLSYDQSLKFQHLHVLFLYFVHGFEQHCRWFVQFCVDLAFFGRRGYTDHCRTILKTFKVHSS